MPILARRYWYITCYIPLVVLHPFINKMLVALAIPLFTAVWACGLYLFMVLQEVLRDFLFEKLGVSRIMLAGVETVDGGIYSLSVPLLWTVPGIAH